ncbi:MAG: hypothetical protein JW941_06500 [Candidatus Coatesbacteria bacterium]|nr:hypothetical protein [Candidatus Coatesbacteria bacterium]
MRRITILFILMVYSLTSLVLVDASDRDVRDDLWARWRDMDFEYSVHYEDYLQDHIQSDTEIGSVFVFPHALDSTSEGRVGILVNSDLYPQIEAELITWVSDINADGFEVVLIEATFESVQELRGALQSAWLAYEGLVGCILVGEFPVPWYAILDSHGNVEDEFPSDIYFEDLDGEFIDSDDDGMFDQHVDGEGNTEPDIWVGRLLASPMTGDEAELVKRYLQKDHLYRIGEITAPHRGLLFIDHDWADLDQQWESAMSWLYDDIRIVTDDDRTNAEEYLKRLSEGYEWVDVMVHSDPSAHYFGYRGVYSMLYNTDIQTAEMNCLFYVPFSCSNSRYVEPDYMGGWYIFGENSLGLDVIGSTKSGSMYYGDEMFRSLSEGDCIGEGFRYWFASVAPYDEGDISWFYGLTLLGDPTLRPTDTAPPEPPEYFWSRDTEDDDGLVFHWSESPAKDLAGYRLHYDTEGVFPPFDGRGLPIGDSPIEMGFATSFTVSFEDLGEFDEITWVVTAYDVRGNESYYSDPLDSTGDPKLNAPEISWVEWDPDTYVTSEGGGTCALRAYIYDGEDARGSLDVELFLGGEPTGVHMYDDGESGDYYDGDGYYGIEFNVPAGLLAPGKYLISIIATDSDGNQSNEWPYLTIPQEEGDRRGSRAIAPATPASNGRSMRHDKSSSGAGGPIITNNALAYVNDVLDAYVSWSMMVYHPESIDDIAKLEIYYGQQPTGIFFERYPEYDGENEAYFWTWFYVSDYSLQPGKYLLEAVATDVDGNESDMFPYLWVD